VIAKGYYDMWDFDTIPADPQVWKQFLMARGCDEIAFSELLCLASSPDWGYSEAMKHLHTIGKKESGGYPVDSVSRYITTVCKDSWRRRHW